VGPPANPGRRTRALPPRAPGAAARAGRIRYGRSACVATAPRRRADPTRSTRRAAASPTSPGPSTRTASRPRTAGGSAGLRRCAPFSSARVRHLPPKTPNELPSFRRRTL
jgi:hypothetical protein